MHPAVPTVYLAFEALASPKTSNIYISLYIWQHLTSPRVYMATAVGAFLTAE